MEKDYIPFNKTGYFSSLITDYLNENPETKAFYNRFPTIEQFKEQIEEKEATFKNENRLVLVNALKNQYSNLKASKTTLGNIEALKDPNTFTITTGHQLNLFTGPLYFLYKIISVLNLCQALGKSYPNYNFVPIYWMATEDHDFEEINYFNFKGKKVTWDKPSEGPVGALETHGLDEVYNSVSQVFGDTLHANTLKDIFKSAYLNHPNLADATRYLANQLFKQEGLVILDANTKDLKQLFRPHLKKELLNQTAFKAVNETNSALEKNYELQVNPREINLFYIKERLRERIVYEDNAFKVLNTEIVWDEATMLGELEEHPERFSPNVIMRPLYQEVILPNLCYIGGGGELAYWLQLKAFFEISKVSFPILLLRNSVLIQSTKQREKLEKLNISKEAIFLNQDQLVNSKVAELSKIEIDFSPQKAHLRQQFKDLYNVAEQTDKSFLGAVKAQEAKQLKGLDKLEKRLLKAQKRTLSDQVERLTNLQNDLFPNQSLQERQLNFSELYLEYGDDLIPELLKSLDPLKMEFLILTF